MLEIFDIILRILSFKIPIPINFLENKFGYVSLFGVTCVFFFLFLLGYIIRKLFE